MARTNAQRRRYRTVGDNVVQKYCNGCNEWKPLYDYYRASPASGAYVKARCKKCESIVMLVKRHGSPTNRGYVMFSAIAKPLEILLHNTSKQYEAAALCGISPTRFNMYIHHPPRQIRKITAARIISAARQSRKTSENGTNSTYRARKNNG